MNEPFLKNTLKPSKSAPVRFVGRIVAEVQWDTAQGCWMRYTVWETRGGAYIAQISGDVPGKPDQVHCTVGVVEPIYKSARYSLTEGGVLKANSCSERDEIAMQIAVLDAFDWHDRAKAMLKRELGWSPVREVA